MSAEMREREHIVKTEHMKTAMFAGVAVAGVAAYLGGFNPLADLDASKGRSVKANIAEFDPDADMDFDVDKWGTELPDEYDIEEAFASSLSKMDTCVLAYRDRSDVDEDEVLDGEVELAIKLNPREGKPAGVNVSLPEAQREDKQLSRCIRDAAYSVGYPKYDGPPRVVNLSFELDPGYDIEE